MGSSGLDIGQVLSGVFVDGVGVEAHKNSQKRKKANFSSHLTEQAWSVKDSSHGFQET